MKVAIFDAFNGASGDMIISALLGVSLDEDDLESVKNELSLDIDFEIGEVMKKGIAAKRVVVKEKRTERNFKEIIEMLERSKIEKDIKEDAKKIFEILAKAEGALHGRDYRNAVFHELGGDDAIFDIVCSAMGIRRLLREGYRIFANPIRTGSGFVEFSHGKYPVPTPAVLEILKKSKLEVVFEGSGELLTPTASAILAYYCEGVFRQPLRIERISYGAGSRESDVPNVIRLILGISEIHDSIAVLETQVDDLSGEEVGFALEKIREKCIDAIAIPAVGKKSRPTILMRVIATMSEAEDIARILMKETGSLGVRIIPVYHRTIADREIEEKEVCIMGKNFRVKFKRSKSLGTFKPEFEDVARIARELEIPIFKVYQMLRCEDVHSERK